jgi:UDP-N-acetyl-D-galactosamine dehydrogenase
MARKLAIPDLRNCRIGIVGLGYVGLPLAVEFGKQYPTTGFDVREDRIAELKRGRDHTRETEPRELRAAKGLQFTADLRELKRCRVFIVTVPTPSPPPAAATRPSRRAIGPPASSRTRR